MLTDNVIKKFLKFECNDLPDQSRIRSTSILLLLDLPQMMSKEVDTAQDYLAKYGGGVVRMSV